MHVFLRAYDFFHLTRSLSFLFFLYDRRCFFLFFRNIFVFSMEDEANDTEVLTLNI